MVLRFLLYAFLAYMLYKLVFDLIIPLARTTKRIRRQFEEVRQQMEGQQKQYQQESSKPENVTNGIGEYIDFEEVKK